VVSEIAVLSGKGGTGKTTITAAFCALSKGLVMADCDVDAPDLHILLHPTLLASTPFISSKVAVIDKDKCTNCGLCEQHCRFDAVKPPLVDPISCEGCGLCEYVCPEGAVRMEDKVSGYLYSSSTRFGPMSHAKILPGEGNSGKLVTEVRQLAVTLAKEQGFQHVLIDGSPGIGCPVIATMTGVRVVIVVTEPTPSGIHDMERVLDLGTRFNVRPMVIINKYDLNLLNSKKIEDYCLKRGIGVLGKVPFDPVMTQSMVQSTTLPEYDSVHPIVRDLKRMWKEVLLVLEA
jgi:MinD superfamily P-loop ATPase